MLDSNYTAHVGWGGTALGNSQYHSLYDRETLFAIQKDITTILFKTFQKEIIVPIKTIGSVIAQVFQANTPEVGSIYSRYIQSETRERNDIQEIINKSIGIIVSTVRDELLIEENNNKLSVWTTILGDFNEHGLTSHPPLKVKKKRMQPMAFHMNY